MTLFTALKGQSLVDRCSADRGQIRLEEVLLALALIIHGRTISPLVRRGTGKEGREALPPGQSLLPTLQAQTQNSSTIARAYVSHDQSVLGSRVE